MLTRESATFFCRELGSEGFAGLTVSVETTPCSRRAASWGAGATGCSEVYSCKLIALSVRSHAHVGGSAPPLPVFAATVSERPLWPVETPQPSPLARRTAVRPDRPGVEGKHTPEGFGWERAVTAAATAARARRQASPWPGYVCFTQSSPPPPAGRHTRQTTGPASPAGE